ncbi:putative gustatory receptor 59d [Drosophila biarmipes]|uniref:putative gustatory receptor 59d n=1 Tax=Drosophila biarmipes TaxID=125945 RepID=UPI001CDA8277|nr:putative gustatory receptor 59d [Drosophila biarmipes]
MVDLVKWCLYVSYFYGRLTGVLNFEIDLRTGQTRITRWATIYAACAQACLLTLWIHHTYATKTLTGMWARTNLLHRCVFLIMAVFRILCALLALTSRWLMRQEFIRLYNSFRRLFRHNPEAIQHFRREIFIKCFFATATEAMQLVMGLVLARKYLTITMILGLLSIVTLTAIINGIITQYFIAIAHIRGSYILLNKELETLLNEAQSLIPRRRGVFMAKCCFLADRLDRIAQRQSELRNLTDRLSKTFEIQLVCMAVSYYLNAVGSFYMMFSMVKYKHMVDDWPPIVLLLGALYFVCFFLDNWITMFNCFHLLDVHAELVKLMKQRTLFAPGLDSRLEKTFESFELSLARNPFRLRFFRFLDADRFTCFSLCNSMITNSIFLIQYDMQNF